MGLRSIRELFCDVCQSEIDPAVSGTFIDARVYGITTHVACFSDLKARQVLRLLSLDDIKISSVVLVLEDEHDPNPMRAWADRSEMP